MLHQILAPMLIKRFFFGGKKESKSQFKFGAKNFCPAQIISRTYASVRTAPPACSSG